MRGTFYTTHSNQSNGLSNNTILRVFRDKADDIWIGTWGGHARYFNFHAPPIHLLTHEINNTNSIVGNDVSALLQENNGTLWITTYNNGVSVLSPDQNKIRSYTYPFLSNNSTPAITQTIDGTIWIGSCYGLNKISPDRLHVTKINLPNSDKKWLDNSMYALYIDPTGVLWVGSGAGKVYMVEQRTNQLIAFECKVNLGVIHDFYMDKNNVLWIAGTNGLFKLDVERKKVVHSDYYQDKNIPYAIQRILPLANGNLLLATTNNGLMEYSRINNSFINLISNALIGSINDMKFDSTLLIWITSSNGLFSYDYESKEILDHAYYQGIQRSEELMSFIITQ